MTVSIDHNPGDEHKLRTFKRSHLRHHMQRVSACGLVLALLGTFLVMVIFFPTLLNLFLDDYRLVPAPHEDSLEGIALLLRRQSANKWRMTSQTTSQTT